METTTKNTLVLGASTNPSRYSNIAIHRLMGKDHPIVAVGRRPGQVGEVEIQTSSEEIEPGSVHTVTLYLNPTNQLPYYDFLKTLRPKRLIFNPGTENPELCNHLREAGTECVYACTLVMLSTGQY